jgi:hypothetical protein
MRFIPLILLLGLAAGCLPIPHTTEHSPEVRGKVLDARTHAPIQGAKVFLYDHPRTSCETDSAGYFCLRATHNFHLAYVAPEGNWPQGTYYDTVDFSHRGYAAREITTFGEPIADVLLEPRP